MGAEIVGAIDARAVGGQRSSSGSHHAAGFDVQQRRAVRPGGVVVVGSFPSGAVEVVRGVSPRVSQSDNLRRDQGRGGGELTGLGQLQSRGGGDGAEVIVRA